MTAFNAYYTWALMAPGGLIFKTKTKVVLIYTSQGDRHFFYIIYIESVLDFYYHHVP